MECPSAQMYVQKYVQKYVPEVERLFRSSDCTVNWRPAERRSPTENKEPAEEDGPFRAAPPAEALQQRVHQRGDRVSCEAAAVVLDDLGDAPCG